MRLLALCMCLTSCGKIDRYPVTGPLGTPLPANFTNYYLVVNGKVDNVAVPMVIDSGAPSGALSPDAFGTSQPPNMADVTFGELTFRSVYFQTGQSGVPSLLGADVYRPFGLGLNYRDALVTIGPAGSIADVQPTIAVPFILAGGGAQADYVTANIGSTSLFRDSAPSRILVNAIVEGQRYTFFVDSGDTGVSLSPTLFQRLAADGRTQLAETAKSLYSAGSDPVIRVRSIILEGKDGQQVEVKNAVANTLPAEFIESNVKEGYVNDGSIGGWFLREHYVTIDYNAREISFARYNNLYFIDFNTFHKLGITFQANPAGPHSWVLISVDPGTDAATKLMVSDQFISVDGSSTDGITLQALDALLVGSLGDTKTIVVLRGTDTLTFTVSIVDLLPPL